MSLHRSNRPVDHPSQAAFPFSHFTGNHRRRMDIPVSTARPVSLLKPVSLRKRLVPNADTLVRSGL